MYMLPQLRKLDDRGVYDQERGAALLHFSSDQAHEFSFRSPDEADRSHGSLNISGTQTHPRVKMVQKAFPVIHSALDDDDVTILDLLSKTRAEAPPAPAVPAVPVGNPFTEIEERIQSRLDTNSSLGQMFASFLTDVTNVIRCHLSDRLSGGFLDDLNEVVERRFLDFSEKEQGLARREKDWKKERISLEQRVEAVEQDKQGTVCYLC